MQKINIGRQKEISEKKRASSNTSQPKFKYTNESLSKDTLELLKISSLNSVKQNFARELRECAGGKQTSLPFIVHTLSPIPLVDTGEIFQVMVIGGSVFKESMVRRGKSGVKFLTKDVDSLPVFKKGKDFIGYIERKLDPTTKVVAINFAFPLIPALREGKLDGILLHGTKEHVFEGLIGKQVGKELEEYFWQKYKRKISFTLANDTVCLLLSGLEKSKWDSLAGGIVGTGLNFAFFTKERELVNLESGNFDKFPLSPETVEIDKNSALRGKGLFEKETAGAYLYQQFNLMIKKNNVDYSPLSSTYELKKLAMNESSFMSKPARLLIEKSAALVASQIAGIVLYKKRDMIFVMEGSFFWEADIYREFVNHYLKILIPDFKVAFESMHDSPFWGVVKLVV